MKSFVRSLLLIAGLPAAAVAYVGVSRLMRPAAEVLAELPATVDVEVGTVDQFTPHSLTAVVENPTGSPVTIAAARSSCGCAPVEDGAVGAVVPAGGSREVTAVYDAALPGEFAKTIRVSLEAEGGSAARTYRFKGTVRRQLEVSPASLFGRPGGSPTLEVRLAFGGPLEIDRVDLYPPGDYEAVVEAAEDDRAVVRLTPASEAAGEYAGTAFVRLAKPRVQTLNVPVRLQDSQRPPDGPERTNQPSEDAR